MSTTTILRLQLADSGTWSGVRSFLVNSDGTWMPPAIQDSAAVPGSIYVSSSTGWLTFKDDTGATTTLGGTGFSASGLTGDLGG